MQDCPGVRDESDGDTVDGMTGGDLFKDFFVEDPIVDEAYCGCCGGWIHAIVVVVATASIVVSRVPIEVVVTIHLF